MPATKKTGRASKREAPQKDVPPSITDPTEVPSTIEKQLGLPPMFNEVEKRLRANVNTMTQQHFRRAMRAAGLPQWDLHNSKAFEAVEKRARYIASDPAFIAQAMMYFRGTPGADALGLCRFISVIAGFQALSEVIRGE